MVRTVFCDSKFESYLSKLGKNNKLTLGLVIGQPSASGKDVVVHLARTPDGNPSDEPRLLSNVSEINNSQVAEHALNCLRMLGGGFNILGLFLVSDTNIMNDNMALQKLKTIIMDIKSTLNSNGLLYACTDVNDNGDKLLINFVSKSASIVCKTISSESTKALASNPVDFKFTPKAQEWQEFETYYEIDSVFPLPNTGNHFDVEKSVMATIDVTAATLNSSTLFFNGDLCDKEITLEKYNKQNKLEAGNNKVKVTIYGKVPKLAQSTDGKLDAVESLVSYSGVISSKVYGTSKNTIGEMEAFIKNDIIRSITTRLQIYYDALLANDDGGNDNTSDQEQALNNTVPPRRVFYPIGNGKVLFSDYLFQNETEETTVKQVKDVMDINVMTVDVVTKAEVAQVKDEVQDKVEVVGNTNEDALSAKDKGSLMIILGIVSAVIALIVALILHFMLK
ncbi:unnamed protein product [Diamesa tonsa]